MKLKRILIFLLLIAFTVSIIGCNGNGNTENSEDEQMQSEDEPNYSISGDKATSVWKSEYADQNNGFADAKNIAGLDFYRNGSLSTEDIDKVGSDDCKYIFYNEGSSRIVNLADGYSITLPTTKFDTDYNLSALRSRYYGENFALTVTKEDKNPYGNNENGWNIYYNEWLARFLDDLNYLSKNNLRRVRAKQELTDLIEGYNVTIFNMEFLVMHNLEYKNYDIAIVRKNDEYVEFYLFVMKSTEQQYEVLDEILKSFSEFEEQGEAKNTQQQYELKTPDYWNDETKAYFELIQNQTSVSWGVFSGSMPNDDDNTYDTMLEKISADQERLENAFDYKFDIMPTYTHLSYYGKLFDFPSAMANELAGGNGFNGKPVMHFSYQFTDMNNLNLNDYTPMFDILNGKYDAQFHKLARQIKEYKKPVLFRLNNEMNTDWTSYCGMVTLLDPDIFIETWQRLYDIFVEEGVDNCIWIFNPVAKTCPYSNWGEFLCYMPGEEYVQMLGLTNYEMNNSNSLTSFEDMYKYVYDNNASYFINYPWIISEFGCGAGGEAYYDYGKEDYVMTEKGRNKQAQADWVKGMFDILNNNQEPKNEFSKNIKAAIWFSVNDYTDVNGESKIVNYFQLNDELTETQNEFKNGFAQSKKD